MQHKKDFQRMARPSNSTWFAISVDSWNLTVEAAWVIGMRLARMAQGGSRAEREAQLMVTEKVASVMELGMAIARGRHGSTPEAITSAAIAHYRRGVRANRDRLSERR
jgi:hypothetical protein